MRVFTQTINPSVQDRLAQFQIFMLSFGYRTPVREDLVAGREMYMVEVERYMQGRNHGIDPAVLATKIKLDDEPIKPSNNDPKQEVVFYHCMVPYWEGQCFVHLEDFLATHYRQGCYANDTRYIVKARL